MISPQDPRLDTLMTFLAVARQGRLSHAADRIGVNHTTVSRRITALETAVGGRVLERSADGWELTELGRRVLEVAQRIEAELLELSPERSTSLAGILRIAGPDAFTATYAAVILTDLQRRNPELSIELISATAPVRRSRSGVDIEVVIGKPTVRRATAYHLADYELGLFASPAYLATAPPLVSIHDLRHHPVIYYIESTLHVDELDRALDGLPAHPPSVVSTSIAAQVTAATQGGGVAILPDYIGSAESALLRVLPEEYRHPLSYWAVVRDESASNRAVLAALDALRAGLG